MRRRRPASRRTAGSGAVGRGRWLGGAVSARVQAGVAGLDAGGPQHTVDVLLALGVTGRPAAALPPGVKVRRAALEHRPDLLPGRAGALAADAARRR